MSGQQPVVPSAVIYGIVTVAVIASIAIAIGTFFSSASDFLDQTYDWKFWTGVVLAASPIVARILNQKEVADGLKLPSRIGWGIVIWILFWGSELATEKASDVRNWADRATSGEQEIFSSTPKETKITETPLDSGTTTAPPAPLSSEWIQLPTYGGLRCLHNNQEDFTRVEYDKYGKHM